MNIVIRYAEECDLEALIVLCAEHAAYENASYHAEGKVEALDEHLFKANPSLHCLVAEADGNLIGYATYMRQFSTWDAAYYLYMDCLFLHETMRGFGIGAQLINRIKDDARKLNCRFIQWQTPNFNAGAIKFYHRIGAVSKSKERFFLEIK